MTTMKPEQRELLQRRWHEINDELERLENLTDDDHDDIDVGERQSALAEELERIERQIDPERAKRREEHGRSTGD